MHGRCIDYQSSHFGLIDEIESGNEGLLLFCQGVGMEQDSKMKKIGERLDMEVSIEITHWILMSTYTKRISTIKYICNMN